ncbi:hypothetical protein HPULCUR_000663 [Helicostylum pulchrum]|uniref:Uncharacterized protein n=1 Tax=Helicostylum pulchrum TaxID=562976 RepID=A0ABP9XMM7_9FUNG
MDKIGRFVESVSYDFKPGSETDFNDGLGGSCAVILIMVMAWPTKFNQFAPQLLFNIYLHTLWGAILALVFPDLRDHDMLGEVFNFFLVGFLIKAGNWYRFIMYGTAFILMYLTRYILVEPFIRLFVVVQHEKKK